ncbi:Cysteine dioxygenase type 1 [Seminavis robusta]|uniref:Cysteine dioxygenase n=1 Tax=Seminavis robusta TaxID=568900 RepID=A0A9N8H591_9STRA|nr:Cysteine dioxygenase type 1 [Seminavis robusta]|eukprot:Sro80_g043210.1 Cysteine dioxygenase type 1 (313) ;mRNA; r:87233-88311
MATSMKCLLGGRRVGSSYRRLANVSMERRFFATASSSAHNSATTTTTAGQRPLSTMPQLQERFAPKRSVFLDSTDENNDTLLRSSSSYVMQSLQFKYPKQERKKNKMQEKQLSLGDFIELVPQAVRLRQALLTYGAHDMMMQSREDPVMALFRNLNLQPHDWAPYAHTDASKAYTRNLITTDDETFTLMLLCWNPAQESKIHDHPCDGCWLSVLQGQVQECRYEYPDDDDAGLKCIADETFSQGQVAFINDSIGLHKVGNPSKDVLAVSLHLYAPPFGECKVWVPDEDDPAGNVTPTASDCATYHSEYGQVL